MPIFCFFFFSFCLDLQHCSSSLVFFSSSKSMTIGFKRNSFLPSCFLFLFFFLIFLKYLTNKYDMHEYGCCCCCYCIFIATVVDRFNRNSDKKRKQIKEHWNTHIQCCRNILALLHSYFEYYFKEKFMRWPAAKYVKEFSFILKTLVHTRAQQWVF